MTTAAALALAPVTETFPLDRRRERRQWKRNQGLNTKAKEASSSTPHSSQKPLWKLADRRLAAGVKPCDPSGASAVSQTTAEPDVGILAQCSSGYSCQPLPQDSEFGAFGGGICVSDDNHGTIQVQRRRRKLQIDNYCTYYVDSFGYDCNCDNCKWRRGCLRRLDDEEESIESLTTS